MGTRRDVFESHFADATTANAAVVAFRGQISLSESAHQQALRNAVRKFVRIAEKRKKNENF
jgi:hypothetical protein